MLVACLTAKGGKVIAAASASKLDVAKRAGADYLVDYTKPKWQQEVLKITNGHGVDIVYDPVGRIQGAFLVMSQSSEIVSDNSNDTVLPTESLKCTAWKARLLIVGFAGGTIEKVWLEPPLTAKINFSE